MLFSLSFVSCANRPDPRIPLSPATAQCTVDCVSVSKAFAKEHADLFDEVIRTRAALEQCREKP